ncbi:hypothetical protein ACSFA7_21750 [Variovorax sp. LT1R20]|uniref:hypothetical protein n=1 Tax=Variovorax sp. LT1R20 TaxID=3443729 RepID=UPI003F4661BC
MFLDPEIIPRSCHWRANDGKVQRDWTEIVENLGVNDNERGAIAEALHRFAPKVAALPEMAKDCGVEALVVEACRMNIDTQAQQLYAFATLVPKGVRSNG